MSASTILINRVVHKIFPVLQERGGWRQDAWDLLRAAEQDVVHRAVVVLLPEFISWPSSRWDEISEIQLFL